MQPLSAGVALRGDSALSLLRIFGHDHALTCRLGESGPIFVGGGEVPEILRFLLLRFVKAGDIDLKIVSFLIEKAWVALYLLTSIIDELILVFLSL